MSALVAGKTRRVQLKIKSDDPGMDTGTYDGELGGRLLRRESRFAEGHKAKPPGEVTQAFEKNLEQALNRSTQQDLENAVEALGVLTVADQPEQGKDTPYKRLQDLLFNGDKKSQYAAILTISDLCSADYEGSLHKDLLKILGTFIQKSRPVSSEGHPRDKVSACLALGKILDAKPSLARKGVRNFLINQVNACKGPERMSERVAALSALRSYQRASGDINPKLEKSLVKAALKTLGQANQARSDAKRMDAYELEKGRAVRSTLAVYNEALAVVLNGVPAITLSVLNERRVIPGFSKSLYATVVSEMRAQRGQSKIRPVMVAGPAGQSQLQVQPVLQALKVPKVRRETAPKNELSVLRDRNAKPEILEATLAGIFKSGSLDKETEKAVVRLIKQREERELSPEVVHYAAACLGYSGKKGVLGRNPHAKLLQGLLAERNKASGGALIALRLLGKPARSVYPAVQKIVIDDVDAKTLGPKDRILCVKAMESLEPKKAAKLFTDKPHLLVGRTEENAFTAATELLSGQLDGAQGIATPAQASREKERLEDQIGVPSVREYYAEGVRKIDPERADQFFEDKQQELNVDLRLNNPPTLEDKLRDPDLDTKELIGIVRQLAKNDVDENAEVSFEERKLVAQLLQRDNLDPKVLHYAADLLTKPHDQNWGRLEPLIVSGLASHLGRTDTVLMDVVKAVRSFGTEAQRAAPALEKILKYKLNTQQRREVVYALEEVNPEYAEKLFDKKVFLRFTNSADNPQDVVIDDFETRRTITNAMEWFERFNPLTLHETTQATVESVLRNPQNEQMFRSALNCVANSKTAKTETLDALAVRLRDSASVSEDLAYDAMHLFNSVEHESAEAQETRVVFAQTVWEQKARSVLDSAPLTQEMLNDILEKLLEVEFNLSDETYKSLEIIEQAGSLDPDSHRQILRILEPYRDGAASSAEEVKLASEVELTEKAEENPVSEKPSRRRRLGGLLKSGLRRLKLFGDSLSQVLRAGGI